MGNATISQRDPITGRIKGKPKTLFTCPLCNSEYLEYESNKRKFCSKDCYIRYQKTTDLPGRYKKGHQGMLEDEHPNWKGENASYSAKHYWVSSRFGRPSKCEFCETEDSPKYEWANVSGNYIRERSDWKRLCKKCHIAFDRVPERSWATREVKGNARGYKIARKTHCRRGHEYNNQNTYYHNNSPYCRLCRKIRDDKRRSDAKDLRQRLQDTKQ